MCCIKITPKRTTINMGEIAIDVDIATARNRFTPSELIEHIDEFIKVNNQGTWSINQTKTNRMDMVLSNTSNNLDYITSVISIYNSKLKENITNYDIAPRSILIEYNNINDNINKELLSLLLNNGIMVSISIIDKNCSYDEDKLKTILDRLEGVSKTKIDYTLLIDDELSVIDFEKYKLATSILIHKIQRKSIVTKSTNEDINIIAFAYEYQFRCYNPLVLNYSTFDDRFKDINEALYSIALQLNDIKNKLNEGG